MLNMHREDEVASSCKEFVRRGDGNLEGVIGRGMLNTCLGYSRLHCCFLIEGGVRSCTVLWNKKMKGRGRWVMYSDD